MITHKPWPMSKAVMKAPLLFIWAMIFAAAFIRKALTPDRPKRWPNGELFTEGDRLADAGVYSRRPHLDHLASTAGLR